jgi:hypothetical protein
MRGYYKMDFREIGWGYMGWIHLVQDGDQWLALDNTVIMCWVPYNFGKFLSS